VDEAHGAHFAFHPSLPTPALMTGADLVVQSTHKLLSALTQASMLHLQGARVDATRISKMLQLLQSSSPSNLLLASLEGARQQMALQGQILLEATLKLAATARAKIADLPGLSVLESQLAGSEGFCELDNTRLTVDVSALGITGYTADEILTQQFGVMAELPTLRHLTFIVSLGNIAADIDRLVQSLAQLVALHSRPNTTMPLMPFVPDSSFVTCPARSPREAFFAMQVAVPIQAAIGRISAETICPYPPGIPLILPGEVITGAAITQLQQIQSGGGFITGCADVTLNQIQVVQ
jgi:arginine decarboxylase